MDIHWHGVSTGRTVAEVKQCRLALAWQPRKLTAFANDFPHHKAVVVQPQPLYLQAD
jgi:hypothetical protein